MIRLYAIILIVAVLIAVGFIINMFGVDNKVLL